MPHADWLPQRDDVTVATGTQDTPATAAAAATVSWCQCASEQANVRERDSYSKLKPSTLRLRKLQPWFDVRCCSGVLQAEYNYNLLGFSLALSSVLRSLGG